jgi:hypothetical protein
MLEATVALALARADLAQKMKTILALYGNDATAIPIKAPHFGTAAA